jgi:hypothetical protein
MTAAPTPSAQSPIQQIPPVDTIRRRLTDLAQERSLLRQLLRLAVRRERDRATQGSVGGPDHAA